MGIRLHRCVESVAVRVVSGGAQLVMEDENVCLACDPVEHLEHLSIVNIRDFLGVIVKIVRAQTCLLVHQFDHNSRYFGPADNRRKHRAENIISSKSSIVQAAVVGNDEDFRTLLIEEPDVRRLCWSLILFPRNAKSCKQAKLETTSVCVAIAI